MIDEHLKSLAAEYLSLIRLMDSGDYDGDELRELSAQRTNTHNELIRVLGFGYTRPYNMKVYCQCLVDS